MIKLENVNKYYNRHKKNELHIINNVSLNLEDHGLVALLGQSGSGKTTLLNAIGGLDKVKSGKIYVDGKKITTRITGKRDKIRNLEIGYIFQDYKLIENISVYDNIAIVLKMIGIKDKKEIKTRVDYVLEKVGMYRYRNRPAGMLSGGEKQRVGIARAIVKAPNIIIADEPTGNLDSQNSLEIMNIIKAISREKLVILVTHENDLAKFYASRIIEIQDGTIKKDYENQHSDELDYQVENNFYLKDFKEIRKLEDENIDINIFSDKKEKLKLDIVVKNGNVYIKSKIKERLEVVDENSNIKFVNEKYKKIKKEEVEKYEFNFENIINKNIKKKYTSIYNPITLIINGFKNVFNFSILKKILLLGFAISAMFIVYSISSIRGTLNIKDEDFIQYNSNYLIAELPNVKVEDFLNYETKDGVDFVLPGDSMVNFTIKYDDFYQTSRQSDRMEGSIASNKLVDESNLIYGKMPENPYELLVDKIVIKRVQDGIEQFAKMSGITNMEQFLNRKMILSNAINMSDFKLVGIVDTGSPSIYADDSMLIDIIASSEENNNWRYSIFDSVNEEEEVQICDYILFNDKIELKKGRLPENDYEVIVNISHKEEMPLNKTIKQEVNNTKLKVVGYYDSMYGIDNYLVSNNTLKYKVITEKNGFIVATKTPELVLEELKSLNLNIKNSYESSKEKYLEEQKARIRSNLTVSGIILGISLIEIFLMIRSSFLSRIREIGILRAIGVKKKDIYKMFVGEIIAITTLASVPGILFMSYVLKVVSTIKYFEKLLVVDWLTVLLATAFIYLFNLLIGLLPVHKVVKKTPAQILSRHDI